MQSNFSDEYNENVTTKKNWSYVKSKSNSHRIPEMVNYNNIYRSSPTEQANLFNTFFHGQFSSSSNYDIRIDYSRNFGISFCPNNIHDFLKNLDPNKAPGPDMVHGKVLKHCSASLGVPLQNSVQNYRLQI